jgi:3-oxoacyl-[acyl-carrier-protein] synthase II
LGVLAANGTGLEAFWDTLVEGRSGIGPITLFDASDLACKIAGEVKGFDPLDHIDPSLKPKRMGRFSQLGVAAARMALRDARLDPATLRAVNDLPIVLGVSTNAMDLTQAEPRLHTAVAGVPHAAASAIGYMYDLNTRLLTVSNGCASSLDAVASAARMVQEGETDLAIAGGTEAAIVHYVFESMLKCRKCSTRNDRPEAASRPFDRDRDYGVLAEGAGIVVVENLDHARARGVTAYGEITGYGTCADPPGDEEGSGLDHAMAVAIANAGRCRQDIDCINAHGPSDIHMDRVETTMIKRALGETAYAIPVTSIKGVTGCPMGTGGVLQLIAGALALRHECIPPTANYEHPDPECDLDYVPGQARFVKLRNVLVNTHGFGRGNSSLLLERVSQERE